VSYGGGWGVSRILLPFGLAAALGACAATAEPPAPLIRAPAPAIAVPALPAAAGFAHPRLPDTATADALVGLSAADLTAAIGSPRWRRRESPAEVWQYQGASCVLDVFLYQEVGAARVVYAEARDESLLPVTLAACLQRIEAERRKPAPAS
jgi:hypothetical protein